jgi:hypothetical protein
MHSGINHYKLFLPNSYLCVLCKIAPVSRQELDTASGSLKEPILMF